MRPTFTLPPCQALPDGPLLLSPDHTGKSWHSELPLTSDRPGPLCAAEPRSPQGRGHRTEDARKSWPGRHSYGKLLWVSDGDFLRHCGQVCGQSWEVKSEEGVPQVMQLEGIGLESQGLYFHSFQKLQQFLAPG